MQRALLTKYPEPRTQVVTTRWHGNNAATTWSHRNVASVTENAVGDTTVTFQEAYQATPAAVLGAGVNTNVNGYIHTITASSIRIQTKNSANALVSARKTSFICVGLI